MIAGSFDYLLKARTAGMPEYRALLAEQVSRLPTSPRPPPMSSWRR
jgi:Lrp/AsnC family leucine-responsive transcriptional regulator